MVPRLKQSQDGLKVVVRERIQVRRSRQVRHGRVPHGLVVHLTQQVTHQKLRFLHANLATRHAVDSRDSCLTNNVVAFHDPTELMMPMLMERLGYVRCGCEAVSDTNRVAANPTLLHLPVSDAGGENLVKTADAIQVLR